MKTVKILINIGTADQHLLKLTEAYTEGQVVDLGDGEAELLIRRRWAKEYDTAAKRDEEVRAKREHEAAVARAMPEAELEIAKERVKEEALRRARAAVAPEPLQKHVAKLDHALEPSKADIATAAEAGAKVDKFAEARAKNK